MKTLEDYRNQTITADINASDDFQNAYHSAVMQLLQQKGLENNEKNYNDCEGEIIKKYNLKFKF